MAKNDNEKKTAKIEICTISARACVNGGATDFVIGGSYIDYDEACEALADWVMDRLHDDESLVWAFANDSCNPLMRDSVKWVNRNGYGRLKFTGNTEAEVREYVLQQIRAMDGYYIGIYEDGDTFHFDLDRNGLLVSGPSHIKAVRDALDNAE